MASNGGHYRKSKSKTSGLPRNSNFSRPPMANLSEKPEISSFGLFFEKMSKSPPSSPKQPPGLFFCKIEQSPRCGRFGIWRLAAGVGALGRGARGLGAFSKKIPFLSFSPFFS
jgi:hypothetical protein